MVIEDELDEAVTALREGKKVEVVLCGVCGYACHIVQIKDGDLWVLAEDVPLTGNTIFYDEFEAYKVSRFDHEFGNTLLQELEYLVLHGPSDTRTANVAKMDCHVIEE